MGETSEMTGYKYLETCRIELKPAKTSFTSVCGDGETLVSGAEFINTVFTGEIDKDALKKEPEFKALLEAATEVKFKKTTKATDYWNTAIFEAELPGQLIKVESESENDA